MANWGEITSWIGKAVVGVVISLGIPAVIHELRTITQLQALIIHISERTAINSEQIGEQQKALFRLSEDVNQLKGVVTTTNSLLSLILAQEVAGERQENLLLNDPNRATPPGSP